MRQHNRTFRAILTGLLTLTISVSLSWGLIEITNRNAEAQKKTQEQTVPETIKEVTEVIIELPKVETEAEPEDRWTSYEGYLLARIAMAEAESEDTECKALVILTVLNRVGSDSFPDSIEEVIFQKGQFSPISNGRWDRVEPDKDCWAALDLVESGWDESQGALYFEASKDHDTWHSRNLVKLFEHGVTTFYTEDDAV